MMETRVSSFPFDLQLKRIRKCHIQCLRESSFDVVQYSYDTPFWSVICRDIPADDQFGSVDISKLGSFRVAWSVEAVIDIIINLDF